MLLLKIPVGKAIVIAGNIKIVVTDTGRGWARIGVEAPKEVIVDREEIAERRAAAKGS